LLEELGRVHCFPESCILFQEQLKTKTQKKFKIELKVFWKQIKGLKKAVEILRSRIRITCMKE
jgi:hypothetical protein